MNRSTDRRSHTSHLKMRLSTKMFLFISFIHSRYTVPSEKTFRLNIIPEMAGKVRQKMKTAIELATANGSFFSLTTDIWSSLANDSYISITAHFLTGFQRQNVTLSVSLFNDSHTADKIGVKFMELIEQWGLEEQKIWMVLRDNAANMKKAFRDFGFDSFGCLAHTLAVRTEKLRALPCASYAEYSALLITVTDSLDLMPLV